MSGRVMRSLGVMTVAVTATAAGCAASASHARHRPLELVARPEAIESARAAALSRLVLSNAERDRVRTRQPSYGFYRMSGTFGQGFWRRSLPDGARASVGVTGDFSRPIGSGGGVTVEYQQSRRAG